MPLGKQPFPESVGFSGQQHKESTMMINHFLFLFCLLVVLGSVLSKNSTNPKTLLETLTPIFTPPNAAANALVPTSSFTTQTPIVVRYILLLGTCFHEIFAACDPVVLSFFGTKDPISKQLCEPLPKVIIQSRLVYRLLASEFPLEARGFGRFLISAGINPFDKSTDTTTEAGWANEKAERLIAYFRADGWNSLGDETKEDFLQLFQDSSDYIPQNAPGVLAQKLRRPLRWQPLSNSVDLRGEYGIQIHVVPHLGIKAKPLALSRAELNDRKVDSPYSTPNRRNFLSKEDSRTMKKLLKKLLAETRGLTREKVALAWWWENKFVSLGSFLFVYQASLGYDNNVLNRFLFSEMITQHDAVLVAWKEKRRHDLVRPTTLIRRLLAGKKVRAWRGLDKGVGLVKAEEWEPVVPIQPHSEFPSASAVLCTSTMEHLKISLEEFLGGNKTIPKFKSNTVPGFPEGNPILEEVPIEFATLEDAARSCGDSRLFSGVHFAPSVPAGDQLAKGIGKAAFEHVSDLYAGRVPKNCERCISS